MISANCPKCGASDVTTAGVCANCGWIRFPQAMGAGESKEAIYNLVGEIEIKVTGKALLDDYKRLLFENNSLTARIAEIEATVEVHADISNAYEKRISEIVSLSNETVERLNSRIAELEAESERFIVHSTIERQDDKWIPEVQE